MNKQKLIRTMVDGLGRSCVSYSHFHVSATLLYADGTAYVGNSTESAAYTPSVCAKRCAIFRAVGDGRKGFEAIAVYGGPDGMTENYCPPCGVCRQAMRELRDLSLSRVLVAKTTEDYREYTLE